jgi:hypothetical protein
MWLEETPRCFSEDHYTPGVATVVVAVLGIGFKTEALTG